MHVKVIYRPQLAESPIVTLSPSCYDIKIGTMIVSSYWEGQLSYSSKIVDDIEF